MSFVRKIKKKNGKVYLAEVENKWINGKCVQKHIRYIGKECDGETILSSSISNIQVEKVKVYGPLLVLDYLASQIQLSKYLGNYGNEILSMVYAHCLDYKSLNQMSRWFERTDLNMLLGIELLTERRLRDSLEFIEECDLEKMQKDIFESVKNRYKISDSGIIYDVTNTYLYGKKCPLGKLGKDKDKVKGRPLIQIGLGVTKEEGIPVFHKIFNGNIHDSRTLQDLITSFEKYDITSGLIIFDKGITSKDNLRDIIELEWDIVCGVAINVKLKEMLRFIINDNRLIQLGNRVRLNKTIFYVILIDHQIGTVKGTLAICYNDQQKRDLREARYDEISNAQKLLKENKNIKEGLERYFDNRGEIIQEEVKKAEEFDGYSFVFSTIALSKEDIVKYYFDKDIVEKAFRSLKGTVKIQPVRYWLSNMVIAHVFICYLSYLLLSLLKYRLKNIHISPVEALIELETMYKVYMKDSKKDFNISRVVTLNKKQELILKTINKKLLKKT